jgi:hypothetical protein
MRKKKNHGLHAGSSCELQFARGVKLESLHIWYLVILTSVTQIDTLN